MQRDQSNISGSENALEDRDATRRAEEAGVLPGAEGSSFPAPAERLTAKAATQERILVSATELFLARGYANTTTAQVA